MKDISTKYKSNHQLAIEYNLKQGIVGKNILKYKLLDNDKVALIKVLDTENTRKLIIPSFITDIGNNQDGDSGNTAMIYPLSACRFKHIIVENKPDIEFNASRLCGYMRSTEIRLEFRHSECVTNLNELFKGCSNLSKIDISKLDTSNVRSMDRMFSLCNALESLDISHFNTQNLESMKSTFLGCERLTELDISNFNTSKVRSIEKIFCNCSRLKNLVLGNIDTSRLENMADAFTMCESLEYLDLSNLDLSNVKNMSYAFMGCKKLKSINTDKLYLGKHVESVRTFESCGITDKIKLIYK